MINYLYIIPEIIIVIALCGILVLDLFLPNYKNKISYYLIQLSLLICSIYLLYNYNYFAHQSSNIYSTGAFSSIFKIFILFSLIIIFHYTYSFLTYFRLYKSEYFLISLFGLLGMMIMVSAEHLLLLYLGIELLSLSLYSVIAFNKKSLFSSEAAVKYYILGAISSGFLLFGISLIYGLTGSLYFHEIHNFISSSQIDINENNINTLGFIFALTFILISLAFKFGAAPFHMWIPDVYHGSLISTTLLLSTLPKIAIFIIILKILAYTFIGLSIFWSDMLIILSVISIMIGNIIAISQQNIKRMLAYSTIANIGFILLGVSVGLFDGYKASMFYTITYVITTIAAFGLVSQLICKENAIEDINELKGLNSQDPLLAFLLMAIMLSYIGIPPLLGFHAKLFIIQALIEANNIKLSIFAVIMTVIGSYYYLRIIKIIYFDKSENNLKSISSNIVTSIYVIALIILGLFPNILGQLSSHTIANFFNA